MNHKHYWITHFITIDFVDQASGMICFCGETLTQDEVEVIVNKQSAKGRVLKSGEPSDVSKERIELLRSESRITEDDRLTVQDALVRRFC